MTQTDDRELLRALLRIVGYDARLYCAGEWRVSTPPGIEWVCGAFANEDTAWDYIARRAPKLLHSVDAAMGLPWPAGYELAIDIERGISYVVMWPDGNDAGINYEAEGKSLARALCEVFYAWWQEKGKQP